MSSNLICRNTACQSMRLSPYNFATWVAACWFAHMSRQLLLTCGAPCCLPSNVVKISVHVQESHNSWCRPSWAGVMNLMRLSVWQFSYSKDRVRSSPWALSVSDPAGVRTDRLAEPRSNVQRSFGCFRARCARCLSSVASCCEETWCGIVIVAAADVWKWKSKWEDVVSHTSTGLPYKVAAARRETGNAWRSGFHVRGSV